MNEVFKSLNGLWKCAFGGFDAVDAIKASDLPAWSDIEVPRALNQVFPLKRSFDGVVTYGRRFLCSLRDIPEGCELVLCCAGLYPRGEIFVNGREAGTVENGFAPHCIPITQALKDGENFLLIRIPIPERGGGLQKNHSCPLGLWGGVWLEIRPEVNLDHVGVATTVDGSWRLNLAFSKPLPEKRRFDLQVLDANGHIVTRMTIELGAGKRTFTLPGKPLERVQKWSLSFPTLYRLKLCQTVPCRDEMTVRLAFRSFGIDADGFRLNGRRFFLRAVWDELLFPEWVPAVSYESALRRRLLAIKNLGFNTLYVSNMVSDRSLVRLADELGLLLWYALPHFQRFTSDGAMRLKELLHHVLKRDAASPSLVMISLFGDDVPEQHPDVERWLEAEGVLTMSSDPVLLPGPSPMFRRMNPFVFLPCAPSKEEEDALERERERKPAVAWPIVLPRLPELKTALEGVQYMGNIHKVRKELERAQSEAVLDAIAEMRGLRGVHGYLIEPLFDGDDGRNGIFRKEGTERLIAQRLRQVQQGEDWVGVTKPERVVLSGRRAEFELSVSHFSGRRTSDGKIGYSGEGMRGEIGHLSDISCFTPGHVVFTAPCTANAKAHRIDLALQSRDYHLLAENCFEYVLLPAEAAPQRPVHLGEGLADDRWFQAVLQERHWDCAGTLSVGTTAVCSSFDYGMSDFFKRGGRAVFLFEHPAGFPASLQMKLQPLSDAEGFLWLRSDSPVFSHVTERWIPGAAYRHLAAPFFIEGISPKNYCDVLAATIGPGEDFFKPVMVQFRLGHGAGIMCTFPLRRLCAEGDHAALQILEAAVRFLGDPASRKPWFEPAVSQEEFLVPLSRDGSTLWSMSFKQPHGLWYGKAFNDSLWRRSRGAFGRRGAPGIVIRHTWESPEIFLRTWFPVERIPRTLLLHLFHDRDVTVALNGRIIFERNGYTTDLECIEVPFEPARLLVGGANLLAVHCRQPLDCHNLDVGLEAKF